MLSKKNTTSSALSWSGFVPPPIDWRSFPVRRLRAELSDLNELLREQLLPHERQDDAQIYPAMARLIGGDDPLAAMSRMHREIHHLAPAAEPNGKRLAPGGPGPRNPRGIQRILYGLDAILRLHFAQEDEIYHTLAEAA